VKVTVEVKVYAANKNILRPVAKPMILESWGNTNLTRVVRISLPDGISLCADIDELYNALYAIDKAVNEGGNDDARLAPAQECG